MMVNRLIIKSNLKKLLPQGRYVLLFLKESSLRFILILILPLSGSVTLVIASIPESLPLMQSNIQAKPLVTYHSPALSTLGDTLPPNSVLPQSHPIDNNEQTVMPDSTEPIETDTLSNDTIYVDVELMPEYYGGIDSLMSYLGKNINYPRWEFEHHIQGTVHVTFVVSSEGKIKNVQITKSVPDSKNFDQEVLRVISTMPDWMPGEHEGKKVDVSFKLPITFRR